jgi:hypothetical protein
MDDQNKDPLLSPEREARLKKENEEAQKRTEELWRMILDAQEEAKTHPSRNFLIRAA